MSEHSQAGSNRIGTAQSDNTESEINIGKSVGSVMLVLSPEREDPEQVEARSWKLIAALLLGFEKWGIYSPAGFDWLKTPRQAFALLQSKRPQ